MLLTALIFTSCSTNPVYKSVDSQQHCAEKNGYWYKGKCWKDFEDEGIAKEDIDAEVAREMSILEEASVMLNSKSYPIGIFFPEMEKGAISFITTFGEGDEERTLIQSAPSKQLKKGEAEANAVLLRGDLVDMPEQDRNASIQNPIATGSLKVSVHDLDRLDMTFQGTLKSPGSEESYDIKYQGNESILGGGTSTVEVVNREFHINGELGTRTFQQLKSAIASHPEIKVVVLGNINGSLNDAVNMHTGRILREAGLHTKVLQTSHIASGGVDLFCAGTERIVEKGAQIGIHSWCCVGDLTAIELDKDHPAHQYQLEYYTMCLGEQLGPDFYFHTLSAAPFDSVHYMSDEDIVKWKIATTFLD